MGQYAAENSLKYTLDEERVMFDSIMRGIAAKQVLNLYLETRQKNQIQQDDIKFF